MRTVCAIAFALGLIAGTPLAAEAESSSSPEPSIELRGQIDHLLNPLVERDLVSGVVLVARGDVVLAAEGYGLANWDHAVPNSPETPFRIASVSKSLTAVAVLRLVERGLIGLDESMATYLPEFPHGDRIKVRHLLSHSSGIPSTPYVEGFFDKSLREHTLEQAIAWLSDEPLGFEPGEKFDYSNSGYILLSRILEVASGLTYEQCMQQYVFQPAGMESSGLDSRAKIVAGRAEGYSHRPGGGIVRAAYRNPSECFGCGALYSTAVDLLRLQRALVDGKLLAAETLAKMWAPGFDTPWGDRYGLGWFVGERQGHKFVAARGGTTGFMSMLRYLQNEDLVVIMLLNQDFMLHAELFERLVSLALGEPWQPLFAPSGQDARDHPLAAFAGDYRMDDGVRVTFTAEEGGFFFEEEGVAGRFEVYAVDEATGFAAEPNARLMFRPATEDRPARLDALYGVLLWRGERLADD